MLHHILIPLLVSPAAAGEFKPDPNLTVGVAELVSVSSQPPHLGLSGLVSLDLAFPIPKNGEATKWTFLTSTGAISTPVDGNWGLFAMFIADYVILDRQGEVRWGRYAPVPRKDLLVTTEPQAGVIHNAVPLLGFDHGFYPTVGCRVSFITHHGAWLPTTITLVGLRGEGFSPASTMLYTVRKHHG